MSRSGTNPLDKTKQTVAEQIAFAPSGIQQRGTGDAPESATVMRNRSGTRMITLREALTPADKAMAQSPDGAAKVWEFRFRARSR